MAIPKKSIEQRKAETRFSLLRGFINTIKTIPYVVKEIPNLPKGKLFKLTGYFLCGSLGMFYLAGPYQRNWARSRVREAELLEEFGLVEKGTSTPVTEGTARAYSNTYGLNYSSQFKTKDAGNASETGD